MNIDLSSSKQMYKHFFKLGSSFIDPAYINYPVYCLVVSKFGFIVIMPMNCSSYEGIYLYIALLLLFAYF